MNIQKPIGNLPPLLPVEAYRTDVTGQISFRPKPFRLRPASEIPPRQWLFGRHLIRSFVSLTVAPGGLGKSSLVQTEALAMATGRSLLGDVPPRPLRVWYWNGEDPREEIERRIAAACQHYRIMPDDLGDRLLMDSGRDVPISLGAMVNGSVFVARPVSAALVETLKANEIDVLVIDPFVTTHELPENDNTAINTVVAEWRRIADLTGCAIELVHHVTKGGAMAGEDAGIYAARGAGALIDGVRSARFLSRMSMEEGERFAIERAHTPSYFRATLGKANLAPPEKATWRRMVSVDLGNGRDLWPEGDQVGVCEAWTPPDAFDDITARDLQRVQKAIEACEAPPKASERASDWVGFTVADTLGLDAGLDLQKSARSHAQNVARAKVRQLVGEWLRSGALLIDTTRSSSDGRDVKIVLVGKLVTEADLNGNST